MSKETGGPAFPVHGGYEGDDPRNLILGGGMTLRDYAVIKFASAWVIALATRHDLPGYTDTDAAYEALRLAEKQADAMIVERAK